MRNFFEKLLGPKPDGRLPVTTNIAKTPDVFKTDPNELSKRPNAAGYQAGMYADAADKDRGPLTGRVQHATSTEGTMADLQGPSAKELEERLNNPIELQQRSGRVEATVLGKRQLIRAELDEKVDTVAPFSDSQRGQQEVDPSLQQEMTDSSWLAMTPAEQQTYSMELNREISTLALELEKTEEPVRWAELNGLLKQKRAAQESLKTVMLRNSSTRNPQ